MMRGKIVIVILPTLIAVNGCASMPEASLGYYLPGEAVATGDVIETVRCNADGKGVRSVLSATDVVVSYTPAPVRHSLSLRRLDGALSSGEFGVSLDEFGQLQSINGKTTGQGEKVLTAFAGLAASAVAAVSMGGAAGAAAASAAILGYTDSSTRLKNITEGGDKDKEEENRNNPCEILKLFSGGEGKTYTATRHYRCYSGGPQNGTCGNDPATPKDADLYIRLENHLSKLNGQWLPIGASPIQGMIDVPDAQAGFETLRVNITEVRRLTIAASLKGTPFAPDPVDVRIPVPTGRTQAVPIPRAVVFGMSELSLGLNRAGGIQQLSYNKDSGAAEMLGGLNALADIPSNAAAKSATALKNRADVIVQQNRLLNCREDGASCK